MGKAFIYSMLASILVLSLALPPLPLLANTSYSIGSHDALHPMLAQIAIEQPNRIIPIIIQKVNQTNHLGGPSTSVRETTSNSITEQVRKVGGTVLRDLSIINAVTAKVPAHGALALSQLPSVRWISPDAQVFKQNTSHTQQLQISDDFQMLTYDGSSGTTEWASSWSELGESDGPDVGDAVVTRFLAGSTQGIRLQNRSIGIMRSVDLSSSMNAQLTISYRRKNFEAASDYIAIEASSDNGQQWVELGRLAGPVNDPEVVDAHFDLTPYGTDLAILRFVTSNTLNQRAKFYLDSVNVHYAAPVTAPAQRSFQMYLPLTSYENGSPESDETVMVQAATLKNYVSDDFASISLAGNGGSYDWAGEWQELGESNGATRGQVKVVSSNKCQAGNCLRIGANSSGVNLTNRGVIREVNLSGSTSATLSFDYRRHAFSGLVSVALSVSNNGGTSWNTLATYALNSRDKVQTAQSFDISAYIAESTHIRFMASGTLSSNVGTFLYLDNIQIDFNQLANDSVTNTKTTSADSDLQVISGCTSCIDVSRNVNSYVEAIGATDLWNEPSKIQGQDVAVAIVDSGIAEHSDLLNPDGSSRVIARVDFVGGQKIADDFYGHGTHVAGIVGGNGSQSDGAHIGVAPKVNLVDVKVTDDCGAGKTSDVIAGIQWILEHKDVYKIRVANLSLNSSLAEPYHLSPLNAALEILWFNGIVVVVSAGNNGNDGILYPPANDPFVITTGAVDTNGTTSTSDDFLAPFSASGKTQDGFTKPDLIAPGADIISTLAGDDSNLALNHPAHAVSGAYGNHYFRMSGTSMASGVAAGAVALLLQSEPSLTPDQVKFRITETANSFLDSKYLNIYQAVHKSTTESANLGLRINQLLWSGSDPVTWGSVNWNSVNWNSVNWNSVNWSSVNWSSVNWSSTSWDDGPQCQ
ncbi:MAG: S8 family peptidase [Chloroflexota bacterium]